MKKLRPLVAAIVAVLVIAAPASASSSPITIPYHDKVCNELIGHCLGTAGTGGTIEMQVTSFRPTGGAAQLTLTEWITVGDISFTAELRGHGTPAGFIVLNGIIVDGSFEGAQIHQRSNFASADGTSTTWNGELQIMPGT